jgi:Ser-tRNA(Ala) deacylase AlaX
METDLLYLRDAEARTFTAQVVEGDESGIVLDRTAFYAPAVVNRTTPA